MKNSVLRIRILSFYPSRIPESKRHRTPDPQHCKNSAKYLRFPPAQRGMWGVPRRRGPGGRTRVQGVLFIHQHVQLFSRAPQLQQGARQGGLVVPQGRNLKNRVTRWIFFYVPESYIMYLSDFCRFLLCTCGWETRGDGGGGGWRREGG